MKKRISILAVILCLAAIGVYFIMAGKRHREIRHIVLISIDTCRADHLSCYGYPRETTPNIDAVAETATLFQNVISPVPITLPAHSSMLTGLIPPAHGVHDNFGYQLSAQNHTLAEILKREGFNTDAVISAFVLESKRGLNQGFDRYHDQFIDPNYNKDIIGNERKGDETTRIALSWIEKKSDEKSFLFLHYYDPHDDYSPPEPFATEFAENPYAGEIAFTDHCIGQVIQKLKELDLYDSTLLIITGDHGEMLGEHGEEEHSYFIYEAAIKVPLIVKLPGQKKGMTVSQPVGLVDLVPTLCALLDIEIPAGLQGKDISVLLKNPVPDPYERFIYSESIIPAGLGASSLMSISAGKWKFIQAPRPELYDLVADPTESNNLIEKEPHRARILEDKLVETLEQSVRTDPDSRMELDHESIRRLESLGYVAGKAEGEATFDQSKPDPKDLIHAYSRYHEARKYADSNQYSKAKSLLESLLSELPEYSRIYYMLGDIEVIQSNFEQALTYYRQAFDLEPEIIRDNVCNNLAWIQSTRPSLAARDLDEALYFAKEICRRTNYRDPNALDTLAVTYAANDNFPKAIETAKKALALANSAKDTQLAAKIANRLKLFEQSQPYVEE